MPHRPERTCIGCRTVCPAGEMARLVLEAERVVIAPGGRSAGRGAWLHRREECLRAAVRGRAFARAFRRQVTLPAPEELTAALLAGR
jgi:predicted RNA-binding protein YlxR (DUF448 family)